MPIGNALPLKGAAEDADSKAGLPGNNAPTARPSRHVKAATVAMAIAEDQKVEAAADSPISSVMIPVSGSIASEASAPKSRRLISA